MATATAERKRKTKSAPPADPLERLAQHDCQKQERAAEARRSVIAAMAIDEEPDTDELQMAYEGSGCASHDQFRSELSRGVSLKKQRHKDLETMTKGAEHEQKQQAAMNDMRRVEAELVEYKRTARQRLRRLDILQRWHRNQHFAGMLAEDRLRNQCDDPAVLIPERKLIDENMELAKQIREIEASLMPQSTSGIAGNATWRVGQIEGLLTKQATANKKELKHEAKQLRKKIEAERAKIAPLEKRCAEIVVELQPFIELRRIP